MQANQEIGPATTRFFQAYPTKPSISSSWMSKLLKGAIFAALIGGTDAYNLTNPFVFTYNACLFAFLTDPILINPNIRDFDYMWKDYWKLFGNMADKIMAGNGTHLASIVPGLKNVWHENTCLLTYSLQSNCSAVNATAYIKAFSDEFKADEIYKDLACKGWPIQLILGVIVFSALILSLIMHMVCSRSQESSNSTNYDSVQELDTQANDNLDQSHKVALTG
jgi:TM2 domain-containing membrane protein YozV